MLLYFVSSKKTRFWNQTYYHLASRQFIRLYNNQRFMHLDNPASYIPLKKMRENREQRENREEKRGERETHGEKRERETENREIQRTSEAEGDRENRDENTEREQRQGERHRHTREKNRRECKMSENESEHCVSTSVTRH